ncbi:MAG: hypothetical protein H5T64_13170 [Chloroflexi bacterium]|nr:hypothetical protein [Chloroflexota bacterium]
MTVRGKSATYRLTFLALFGLILALLLAHEFAYFRTWIMEDAFISFRYVRNFVNGYGLVFNVGERVEGYTNFLWVMVLALPAALGVDIVTAGHVGGVLFSVLASLMTYVLGRWISPHAPPPLSLVSVGFLATSGSWVVWATSGLETPMYAFLLTVAAYAYLHERGGRSRTLPISGLVFALVAMTRPDGTLFWLLTLLHALAERFVRRQRLVDGTVLSLVIGFVVPFGSYFAWRTWYYGYLLPNTFYAKVGASGSQMLRGLNYTLRFLCTYGLYPLLLGALLVLSQRSRPWVAYFSLLLLGYMAYVVAVGGDAWAASRFFAPVLPLLVLLAQGGLEALWETVGPGRKVMLAFGLVSAVVMAGSLWLSASDAAVVLRDVTVRDGRAVGLWFKEHASPGAVLATNTAGAVAYYSELRIIDMLGLNDVHIAHRQVPVGARLAGHEKGDGAYVLARRPDYILFCGSVGLDTPCFRSDQELFVDPLFTELYEKNTVYLSGISYPYKLTFYRLRSAESGGLSGFESPEARAGVNFPVCSLCE